MKVLWFANMPTPDVAEYLGFPKLMSGHWMSEMLSALKERDPVTARKIGDAGRQVCKTEIHYKVHSRRLADFFTTCIRSAQ